MVLFLLFVFINVEIYYIFESSEISIILKCIINQKINKLLSMICFIVLLHFLDKKMEKVP